MIDGKKRKAFTAVDDIMLLDRAADQIIRQS